MNFNKINVNFLSFFISILIFSTIILIINFPIFKREKQKINDAQKVKNFVETNSLDNSNTNDINNFNQIENWMIEIPKLNLKANIKQGTGEETLKNNIGHYENTDIIGSNIALLAYNYKTENNNNNFFSNLKELKAEEKIIYKVNNITKTYKVVSNTIIEKFEIEDKINSQLENNRDENTNMNVIKLLTYVINMPDKMRYVIGIDISSF